MPNGHAFARTVRFSRPACVQQNAAIVGCSHVLRQTESSRRRSRTNDEAAIGVGWGSVNCLHLLPLPVLGFLAQRSPPDTDDKPFAVVAAVEDDGLMVKGWVRSMATTDCPSKTLATTSISIFCCWMKALSPIRPPSSNFSMLSMSVGVSRPFCALVLLSITGGGVDLRGIGNGFLHFTGDKSTPEADQQGLGLGRQTGPILED